MNTADNGYLPSILLLLFSVLLASISQIMLKKSAGKHYGSVLKEYLNPLVIFAYVLFFVTTVCSVLIYRVLPLNYGPVLETSGYIYVTVLSYFFLGERPNRGKILSMLLIIGGILVYSL